MRVLLVSLAMSLAGISVSAHAQPVTFDEPAMTGAPAPAAAEPPLLAPETLQPETSAAPATLQPEAAPETNAPATTTLPDLTPDAVVAPTYGFTPPPSLQQDGKSTINPRLEPWQKERRPDRAKQAEAIFAKLPYEVQNQILDETNYVHRQCGMYETYAQFHDCECLGSIYFEERVIDPESSRDAIVGRISGYCVSLPGAAAFGYDQCLAGMRFVLVPGHVEEYCHCYALQFGKTYQQSPYPDFDNLRAVGRATGSYCLQRVPQAFKKR